jgi:hypothetical protein
MYAVIGGYTFAKAGPSRTSLTRKLEQSQADFVSTMDVSPIC